jgi:hypothetical protein
MRQPAGHLSRRTEQKGNRMNENTTDTGSVTLIEEPVVTELGSVKKLTLGTQTKDTADMKEYYY